LETFSAEAVVCAAVVAVFGSMTRAQSEAEQIYKAKCAGCHAADGSANTRRAEIPGPTTSVYRYDKEPTLALVQVITKGRKKMPKFEEKLKSKEIKELVAYIRGFSKKS